MVYKSKRKKYMPESFWFCFYIAFSGVSILLLGSVLGSPIWAIIGIVVLIVYFFLFIRKASYAIDEVQRTWNEECGIDISRYNVQWEKMDLGKTGKFNKRNVKLRIRELSGRITESSNIIVQERIYREIINICDIFAMKSEKKKYEKQLQAFSQKYAKELKVIANQKKKEEGGDKAV